MMAEDGNDNTVGQVDASNPHHHHVRSGHRSVCTVNFFLPMCLLVLVACGVIGHIIVSSVRLMGAADRYLSVHDKKQTSELNHQYGNRDLFVPTLYSPTYGIGTSNSRLSQECVNFDNYLHCEHFDASGYLKWEWWMSTAKTNNRKNRHPYEREQSITRTGKRLMIGVYSNGSDDDERLLELAAWSARMYGKIWGEGVLVLTLRQRTAFANKNAPPLSTKGNNSTRNKLHLLLHAIEHRDNYEHLLLMDASSFIYNMDIDLTTMMDPMQHILAAEPLESETTVTSTEALSSPRYELPRHSVQVRHEWNVHSGATLWNLRHPNASWVAAEWMRLGEEAAKQKRTCTNDQEIFRSALRSCLEANRNETKSILPSMVRTFQNKEFGDYQTGTVVQQAPWASYHGHCDGDVHAVAGSAVEAQRGSMMRSASAVCTKHEKECLELNVKREQQQ
jgi:hypothetical protein